MSDFDMPSPGFSADSDDDPIPYQPSQPAYHPHAQHEPLPQAPPSLPTASLSSNDAPMSDAQLQDRLAGKSVHFTPSVQAHFEILMKLRALNCTISSTYSCDLAIIDLAEFTASSQQRQQERVQHHYEPIERSGQPLLEIGWAKALLAGRDGVREEDYELITRKEGDGPLLSLAKDLPSIFSPITHAALMPSPPRPFDEYRIPRKNPRPSTTSGESKLKMKGKEREWSEKEIDTLVELLATARREHRERFSFVTENLVNRSEKEIRRYCEDNKAALKPRLNQLVLPSRSNPKDSDGRKIKRRRTSKHQLSSEEESEDDRSGRQEARLASVRVGSGSAAGLYHQVEDLWCRFRAFADLDAAFTLVLEEKLPSIDTYNSLYNFFDHHREDLERAARKAKSFIRIRKPPTSAPKPAAIIPSGVRGYAYVEESASEEDEGESAPFRCAAGCPKVDGFTLLAGRRYCRTCNEPEPKNHMSSSIPLPVPLHGFRHPEPSAPSRSRSRTGSPPVRKPKNAREASRLEPNGGVCFNCHVDQSCNWKLDEEGRPICNSCFKCKERAYARSLNDPKAALKALAARRKRVVGSSSRPPSPLLNNGTSIQPLSEFSSDGEEGNARASTSGSTSKILPRRNRGRNPNTPYRPHPNGEVCDWCSATTASNWQRLEGRAMCQACTSSRNKAKTILDVDPDAIKNAKARRIKLQKQKMQTLRAVPIAPASATQPSERRDEEVGSFTGTADGESTVDADPSGSRPPLPETSTTAFISKLGRTRSKLRCPHESGGSCYNCKTSLANRWLTPNGVLTCNPCRAAELKAIRTSPDDPQAGPRALKKRRKLQAAADLKEASRFKGKKRARVESSESGSDADDREERAGSVAMDVEKDSVGSDVKGLTDVASSISQPVATSSHHHHRSSSAPFESHSEQPIASISRISPPTPHITTTFPLPKNTQKQQASWDSPSLDRWPSPSHFGSPSPEFAAVLELCPDSWSNLPSPSTEWGDLSNLPATWNEPFTYVPALPPPPFPSPPPRKTPAERDAIVVAAVKASMLRLERRRDADAMEAEPDPRAAVWKEALEAMNARAVARRAELAAGILRSASEILVADVTDKGLASRREEAEERRKLREQVRQERRELERIEQEIRQEARKERLERMQAEIETLERAKNAKEVEPWWKGAWYDE